MYIFSLFRFKKKKASLPLFPWVVVLQAVPLAAQAHFRSIVLMAGPLS